MLCITKKDIQRLRVEKDKSPYQQLILRQNNKIMGGIFKGKIYSEPMQIDRMQFLAIIMIILKAKIFGFEPKCKLKAAMDIG